MLVFCASRKQTQKCAELLADLLPSQPGCTASAASLERRQDLVAHMHAAMGGFTNSTLDKLLLAGKLAFLYITLALMT